MARAGEDKGPCPDLLGPSDGTALTWCGKGRQHGAATGDEMTMRLPTLHAATLGLLTLVALQACQPSAAPLTPPGGTACAAEAHGLASAEEAGLLRLVNAARAGAGLPALARDPTLSVAAGLHACDLAARGALSHLGRDGADLARRLARQGLNPALAAENIAAGQKSLAEVMSDWMASPGHRANILRPGLTGMGLGLAGGDRPYWVLVLAGPPLD